MIKRDMLMDYINIRPYHILVCTDGGNSIAPPASIKKYAIDREGLINFELETEGELPIKISGSINEVAKKVTIQSSNVNMELNESLMYWTHIPRDYPNLFPKKEQVFEHLPSARKVMSYAAKLQKDEDDDDEVV